MLNMNNEYSVVLFNILANYDQRPTFHPLQSQWPEMSLRIILIWRMAGDVSLLLIYHPDFITITFLIDVNDSFCSSAWISGVFLVMDSVSIPRILGLFAGSIFIRFRFLFQYFFSFLYLLIYWIISSLDDRFHKLSNGLITGRSRDHTTPCFDLCMWPTKLMWSITDWSWIKFQSWSVIMVCVCYDYACAQS